MKRTTANRMAFIPNRFHDQAALVVGGAQGIGKAIAARMAHEGARVTIADIDRKMMARTAREITAHGGQVRTVYCDVRRRKQVEQLVGSVVRWCGRIDVLMYIAGVADSVPFLKSDEKLWDRTLDINLKGAYLVARAVVPYMVRRRRGRMVFMSSTNSWDAEAELAHYNVSKAGVFLLAKTLAREFGPFGIRTNAVGPGFIRTRLTEPLFKNPDYVAGYQRLIPLGRLGTPEDVAGPATFLASNDADYVNGVLLFIDGGRLA
jgi:NAD(P)-dependent dehydrogenase (short-subunit alcohol dehydrogenase family)